MTHFTFHIKKKKKKKRVVIGVMLLNPEGQDLRFPVKLNFFTTNNEAEYKAVIAGLSIAREVGAKNIEIQSDSQVVAGQVQGEFETQEVRMARYLEKVRKLQSCFDRVVITKVPREANTTADELSKLASGSKEEIEASGQEVIVLAKPSISQKYDVMELEAVPVEPRMSFSI